MIKDIESVIVDEMKIKNDLDKLKEAKSYQLDTKKRIDAFRDKITATEKIDIFSRDVLETTVDKIIVGGYDIDYLPGNSLQSNHLKNEICISVGTEV